MITNDLKIAFKEVNEILNNIVPEEYVSRIPKKFRSILIELEDKNYVFNVDLDKNIDEQNITEKTKDLITVIYRNYWCNDEEKKELDMILTENEKKYQEELSKIYNPDNLFKKKEHLNNIPENNTSENNEATSLVEIKELNFFQKIFDKIKNLFLGKKQ